jgi:hypothetical protein
VLATWTTPGVSRPPERVISGCASRSTIPTTVCRDQAINARLDRPAMVWRFSTVCYLAAQAPPLLGPSAYVSGRKGRSSVGYRGWRVPFGVPQRDTAAPRAYRLSPGAASRESTRAGCAQATLKFGLSSLVASSSLAAAASSSSSPVAWRVAAGRVKGSACASTATGTPARRRELA